MTQNCLVPHEEKKFSTQKGATYIPFPTIHSHEVGENMLNMLNMLKSSLKRLYIIYIKFVKWVPFSPTNVTVNLRGREWVLLPTYTFAGTFGGSRRQYG